LKFGDWLGLLALTAALTLLWSLRQGVILIFAAVVLAMALCTLVGAVRERLGWARLPALLLSLGAVVLLTLLAMTVILPPFFVQFSQLLQKLPIAAERLASLLHQVTTFSLEPRPRVPWPAVWGAACCAFSVSPATSVRVCCRPCSWWRWP
jgi:predicted PurR-regulated permease PerM